MITFCLHQHHRHRVNHVITFSYLSVCAYKRGLAPKLSFLFLFSGFFPVAEKTGKKIALTTGEVLPSWLRPFFTILCFWHYTNCYCSYIYCDNWRIRFFFSFSTFDRRLFLTILSNSAKKKRKFHHKWESILLRKDGKSFNMFLARCYIILHKINQTWFFCGNVVDIFPAAVEMLFWATWWIGFDVLSMKCHFLHQICFSFSFLASRKLRGDYYYFSSVLSKKCEESTEGKLRKEAQQNQRRRLRGGIGKSVCSCC